MAIVIDGIIGAGKTTVGNLISEHYGIEFFEEMKSETEINLTQRMLDRFYVDQERWSAVIQVMFLNDRFKDIKAVEASGKPAVFDRSIYGDEVFARTIHERGQMTKDEFSIYKELLSNMLKHIRPPEVLIYLDVSVDVAMERIKKRSRSTEAELIPRDYMEDLKKHYEAWFESFNLCPKIRIDFNEVMINNSNDLLDEFKKKLLKMIDPYIEKRAE